MTAEAEALGECTECRTVYPVYEQGGTWHALGTDGGCRCGNSEFDLLSAEE
jgi:hypothetical protein